ncbi:hypothetical protein R5R35_008990 [Gryllus longicercus]|uniref:WD repeat-containing protein 89 n=2 Tax=Gryllus longicercus TaxID=2509291 RepID=A0AAN9VCY3_9ORTH
MNQLDTLFSMTEDLNTNSDEDADIVSDSESAQSLIQYYVEQERSLSLQRTYILHMSCSQGVADKLFLGLSNCTSVVYDIETLSKVACLSGHDRTITGVKVGAGEDDVVFTSSLDGTIKLWDLRLHNNMVREYKDASEGDDKLKPISSFDISSKKTVIAAGTELFDGDAFMLFWDARSSKLLGGYWESHRDDITHIQFHPSKKDWLATGSTDGLMNVFDISECSEDDALLYSMNTESSVDKLQWFMCLNEVDGLSCITHTQDLQVWETDGVIPYAKHMQRDIIAKVMHRTSSDYCYLVDFLPEDSDDEVSLLAGSTAGKGECLKMLKVQKKTLTPVAVFNGNKQIVRSCCSIKQKNLLVTGGESGFFTLWKSDGLSQNISAASLKVKTKSKHSSVGKKPY